jgi:hypothetical protein
MEKKISSALRTTFLIHFLVGIIFGLIFLLFSEVWGELVGWPVTEPSIYRLLGAAILGYGISSWLVYRDTVWERVKIVIQMEIVWTGLGALVMLWGLVFEGVPAIGWLYAVLLAAFTVAFSVFYFRK